MSPWFRTAEGVPYHWIGPLPPGVEEIDPPVPGEWEAEQQAKYDAQVKAEQEALAAAAKAPVAPSLWIPPDSGAAKKKAKA